jgi:hypothetical protein
VPHGGGSGLTVRRIHIHHPADGIVVSFNTTPSLRVNEIDGSGGESGSVALSVVCPRCSPKGDAFYLEITSGETHVRDGVARAHWSTDQEFYAESPLL